MILISFTSRAALELCKTIAARIYGNRRNVGWNVDGWKISPEEAKTLRHMGDFIEAVREEGGTALAHELSTDYEVKKAIEAVFNVLRNRISRGEIEDIAATLPAELRPLLIPAEETA